MAAGNQSDALGEFERYRVMLHAELGAEPTEQLRRLLGNLATR